MRPPAHPVTVRIVVRAVGWLLFVAVAGLALIACGDEVVPEPEFSVVHAGQADVDLEVVAGVIADRLRSAGQVGASTEVSGDGERIAVDPGEGALDLDATELLATRAGHLEFRPVLAVIPPGCDPTHAPQPDAEVLLAEFDADSGTQVACYQLGPVELTDDAVESAAATFPQNAWVVNPVFLAGADGIDRFNAIAAACNAATPTCPTRQLGIVVDGEVVSAPTVNASAFERDQIQIAGSFDESGAKALAAALDTEPLPSGLLACTTTTDCRSPERPTTAAGGSPATTAPLDAVTTTVPSGSTTVPFTAGTTAPG